MNTDLTRCASNFNIQFWTETCWKHELFKVPADEFGEKCFSSISSKKWQFANYISGAHTARFCTITWTKFNLILSNKCSNATKFEYQSIKNSNLHKNCKKVWKVASPTPTAWYRTSITLRAEHLLLYESLFKLNS